ncbi:tyrosine-type recombinase/integrase [Paenibacillus sp. LMG 31456]|uniref:Tyrosine-type recombinase/integrase n=1 Tax=Paenibacillus foliorum TaxID=2654974 RepID=A0A972GQD1_9BACL|nr:site-specific integrase [Paenibacillus foliorum]NOU94909.1 tyrosine-type recombinase/integrase [Paenibacillus foliorum]
MIFLAFLLQSGYFQFWSDHFMLSKSTKQGYIIALKRFEAFLLREGFEGTLDFDQFHASREHTGRYLPIQRQVIDRFVFDLKKKEQVTDKLIASTISALKRFFEFLHDMNLIQHNPMLGYPRPKFESPIQNTSLSKEECYALLRAALLRNPFYRQEFVFIWFMLITGLRSSEVRFLRRKRLNLKIRIIQVFDAQKTDKRSVALPKDLTEELKRYTQHPEYIKYEKQGDEYLFHQQGKIMTVDKIKRILSELTNDANLARHIRPHDLRRTAGYLMQTGGMNIVDIQHQLRHKNVGTTLRYVPPLNDLAKILEDT